jgi:hypothetical protein
VNVSESVRNTIDDWQAGKLEASTLRRGGSPSGSAYRRTSRHATEWNVPPTTDASAATPARSSNARVRVNISRAARRVNVNNRIRSGATPPRSTRPPAPTTSPSSPFPPQPGSAAAATATPSPPNAAHRSAHPASQAPHPLRTHVRAYEIRRPASANPSRHSMLE